MKKIPTLARMGDTWVKLALCSLLAVSLRGADVAPSIAARALRVAAASSGSENRVACADAEVASELKLLGVELDPKAKVAWAANEQDVKTLAQNGHLVVCGRQSFLAKGAGIALALEGGRPVVYLSIGNVKASKVTLSDSIIKIAKVQP
jgi:hypothetical protein